MIYKPSKESHSLNNEQAQRYGERIAALEEEFGGVGTFTVVQDAKKEDSPLHDWFEWDDEIAANEYRTEQARYLLRHIVVSVKKPDGNEEEVRAFHSVTAKVEGPTVNSVGTNFVTIQSVLSDEEWSKEVVQNALKELERWRKKYGIYKELAKVIKLVDKAIQLKSDL